ncbi:MAGE-domain-containing protein [Delitschia confertaspora ATCC 74209]|uniref:MAGE-domain-containing protein n=1 Tax=Delitschia confertaspora ATCC 74209 TaxID=1513339 RepID=A0A9P4JFP0_9PLEO|nr:MAGE-domain-containing protein [Delitschia confertaspora ATCC 74209]
MPLTRKRRAPADEVDEEGGTTISSTQHRSRPSNADQDADYGEESHTAASGSFEQLSKSLVRYALACEYARIPIKRQDINHKILRTHARSFKDIFNTAQYQLQDTFGMQMEELPNREKVTVKQRRGRYVFSTPRCISNFCITAAAISETQTKGSNQWVLKNILPDRYRIPEIIAPPRIPTSEVESAYVGLYTMIISLIALSGGTLPEAKLERFLKRVNADQSTPVDKTDKLLARMTKEGYIVKVKDQSSSTAEELIDYMVGPRGKVEVGDEGVAGLVRAVYGKGTVPDLEKRIERSLGISERRVLSTQTQPTVVNGDGAPANRAPGRPRRQQNEAESEEE